MNAIDYARRVCKRITQRDGAISTLEPLSDMGLYLYLELNRCMQVRNPVNPYECSGYTLEFCAGELDTLRGLIAEPFDELPPLGDYADQEYMIWLKRAAAGYLPRWIANVAATGGRIHGVYALPKSDDSSTVYLVNEGLPAPRGFADQGAFPLVRYYDDEWRLFDAFPHPYDRAQGRLARVKEIQAP